MKVIYDPHADTMNVIFREERIKESDEVREGVVVDFGYDGNIVGFEILNATQHVAQPRALTFELKTENGN
ncbi:MAG: DUF2283 domain-containing protein [Bacteroidota bacterium]